MNNELSPWAHATAADAAVASLPASHPSAPAAQQLAARVCYAVRESVQHVSPCPWTSCSVPIVLAELAAGRWLPALGFLPPEHSISTPTVIFKWLLYINYSKPTNESINSINYIDNGGRFQPLLMTMIYAHRHLDISLIVPWQPDLVPSVWFIKKEKNGQT